jgi:hypothetical protein
VFLVDVASRSITHTFDVYRRPRGIAWAPDGSRAWVTSLLQPEYFGRLTEIDPVAMTATEIEIYQVFGLEKGGYPSSMQNITVGPAPGDSVLWMPTPLVNSAKGALEGHPITAETGYHAVVKFIDLPTRTDRTWDAYFLSEGGTPNLGFSGTGTPVCGPVAVDFRQNLAFVANLQSQNVTVLTDDPYAPVEMAVIPAGNAPIGIVTHPDVSKAYVANWLSRDVTVCNTTNWTVMDTAPSTARPDPLTPQLLQGKQLFFSSRDRMSFENRVSCSSCHPFGYGDGHTWDFSQFGLHIRATKDFRGIGWTGPLGWTCAADEVQDFEWSIRNLMGGQGLVDGTPNPAIGPPNTGLSAELDALCRWVTMQEHRPDTPYLQPDGSFTAEADSGQVLFNDPTVGCATCHPAPWYTDSSLLENPFIKHDVGTADSTDANAADGFDTPSLVGVWDSGPWLHNQQAKTLEDMLTVLNPNDEHGTTSHLAPDQIGFLVEFMKSLGWPENPGSGVGAPEVAAGARNGALDPAYPNPFSEQTSIRFRVDRPRADVRVDVFDVTGRRVRTLLARPMTRGTHVVGWDGRDADGRLAAPGSYFARLALDGVSAGGKRLTLVR